MSAAPATQAERPDEAQMRQRKGTRQLLLGRALFMASGYVVSVILARGLGPALYGYYGVLISLISRVEMITSAGVPGAVSKLIPESRGKPEPIESTAHVLLFALGLLSFGFCWLAAPAVARSFDIPNGTTLLRIGALDVPLAAIWVSYSGILNGHRRFGALAIAQMIYAGGKVGGVLLLLWIGMSLGGVLLANAGGTLLACSYLALRFRPHEFRFDPGVVRSIGAVAVPLAAYLIGAQLLGSMDLWVLQAVWRGSQEDVGRYVAALNIGRTLIVIPTVQSGVLFASMAWAHTAGDLPRVRRHIQEASRFAIVVAVGALVTLGPDASAVMGTIFSSAYAPGGRFLVLHLVAFGLYALLDAYAHCQVIAGRQWLTAGVLLGLLPLVLASNLLLIPAIGPIGAAWSLVLGMAVGTAILAALTYRRFGAPIRRDTLARVVGAAVVVTVVAKLVPVAGVWVLPKVATLGVAYLALLVWWGEVSLADFGLGRAHREGDESP